MTVYECILGVAGDLAKDGIAKDSKNVAQGFNFRGIDAVYNALAPALVRHKLVMLPRMISRSVIERTNAKGNVLFSVTVEAEFDLVSAVDGSRHTVKSFGEAMDTGDKATNKAMSAAYKYAAFQTFCIPTEGDNDADASTHEVKIHAPEGFDRWLLDLEAVASEGESALKQAWQSSPASLRKFLTETDAAKWEAMKAKAKKVSR